MGKLKNNWRVCHKLLDYTSVNTLKVCEQSLKRNPEKLHRIIYICIMM